MKEGHVSARSKKIPCGTWNVIYQVNCRYIEMIKPSLCILQINKLRAITCQRALSCMRGGKPDMGLCLESLPPTVCDLSWVISLHGGNTRDNLMEYFWSHKMGEKVHDMFASEDNFCTSMKHHYCELRYLIAHMTAHKWNLKILQYVGCNFEGVCDNKCRTRNKTGYRVLLSNTNENGIKRVL